MEFKNLYSTPDLLKTSVTSFVSPSGGAGISDVGKGLWQDDM